MVADRVQSVTFEMRVLLVMMAISMLTMMMMIMMKMVMAMVMTMVMVMTIAMMGFLDRWLSGGWDRVIAAYKQLARLLTTSN